MVRIASRMKDFSFLAILIGLAGAILGVYFRESFRRAIRQKTLASKLEVQVLDIMRSLFTSEFRILLALGGAWQKDRGTALSERGPEGYGDVQRKWEHVLEEIKVALQKGNEHIDKGIVAQRGVFQAMPETLASYERAYLERELSSLSSNEGLLSADEAAEISWDVVWSVEGVRGAFRSLLDLTITFLISVRESKELNLSEARAILSGMVEQIVRLSLHLSPLMAKAKLIRGRSLARLTLDNILGRY